MKQHFAEKYNSILNRRPLVDVTKFHITFDGTLERVDVYAPGLTIGSFIFNLYINGVAQFTGVDRLIVDPSNKHAQKTGLAIDIVDGDVVSVNLEGFSEGTDSKGLIYPPFEFAIEVDDGEGGGGGSSDWNTIKRVPGNQAVGLTQTVDAYLTFPVLANKSYEIRGRLDVFVQTATPGFRWEIDFPGVANASVYRIYSLNEAGGGIVTPIAFFKNPTTPIAPSWAGFDRYLVEWEGTILIDGTGGDFEILHSQQNVGGSPAIIRGGFLDWMQLD